MRVTTSKSKNSESFYINHAYIGKNGKSTSKVYRKLGTLKELSEKLGTDRDGVMAWAKEQARICTEQYKAESEAVNVELFQNRVIDKDTARTFNCGYLFLQSILNELKIDSICRNIKNRHGYQYNLQSILSQLVYARILQPCSKRSSYAFAQTLLEPPKYSLDNIYKALSVLSEESDYIQAEVYRNSNFIKKRNTAILYYDCTNYFFEIEQETDFKKYGKSKEHRPNPIVGMGLFMDADGFPLAFDLYPGNQNEQLSLKPLEEKIIKDFDCSKFVFCSDSGLGSAKNKKFNNTDNRDFVITKSLKKLKKEDREIALNTAQYRKIGSDRFIDLKNLDETDPEVFNSIYYKEIPLDSSLKNELLIVTYSPKYKEYERKIRNQQIERAEKMIGNGEKIKKSRKNPNDPARFISKVAYTETGEIAEQELYSLDEEAIRREEMYDGFYGVSTSLDVDVSEIISINDRRWQIEQCFRLMKTEFEARPVYLQREDRIRSHFLICFLALLVYRILEQKLGNKYTAEQTLHELRRMNVCELDGYGYIPAYTRTDFTDSLHNVFGFRTDYQIIKKSKMRNIIHNTKS